jgi:FlaA1/EpsC-like NDP-sugar epimerase
MDKPKMKKILEGKRVLITGGTGSLGKVLTRRILSGEAGHPAKVIVFSRDEAKQHFIRVEYENRVAATDEIIYRNFQRLLEFRIGDIRDYGSVAGVLREADIVVNAAAMKQVPSCEYFPNEAFRTNVGDRHGYDQGAAGESVHTGQHAMSRDPLRLHALWERARVARFGDPSFS